MLVACIWVAVVSPSCTVLFITTECPLLCVSLPFVADVDMATSTFFWLPFASRVIFHPFTLSLYLSLGLRWVSWRQNIVFNPPGHSVFWMVDSIHLSLGWLLINEEIVLVYCFLVGLYLHCFFFLCFCHFNVMVFYDVSLGFPFFLNFNVLSLCSRFVFCDYHEVCVKHLIDKVILLILISFYLHLPTWVLPFSFSTFMFLFPQITPFFLLRVCCQIEVAIFYL